MAFRIECPSCGSKAIISNSNDVAADVQGVFVKDLYCRCLNVKHCGATFVVRAGFSHYLNPPQANVMDMAKALIEKGEQMKLGV